MLRILNRVKRVLIILLLLVVVPMTSFAQSVREEQGSVKVYFRVGATTIDEAYKNNGKSLNKFAEIINSCKEDKSARIGRISIVSSTSPEGSKAVNDRIAEQRAKAITDWLMAKTSAELVYNVESMRTDWGMLISAVESRKDVPYREEVLEIMRNTPEFVEREGDAVAQRSFAQERGLLVGSIADRINEISADILGDILLEETSSGYKIIDDYAEDFKNV